MAVNVGDGEVDTADEDFPRAPQQSLTPWHGMPTHLPFAPEITNFSFVEVVWFILGFKRFLRFRMTVCCKLFSRLLDGFFALHK